MNMVAKRSLAALIIAFAMTSVAQAQAPDPKGCTPQERSSQALNQGAGTNAGVICPPNLATYAATKAFITHHTVNLAEELRHTPVGFTKVEIGEVADTGLMDKGRTDPTFTALVQRLYRLRLSRLITPQEITKHTLAAIEQERLSVRLPRRIGLSSYLVDAPRTLSALAARDLRRGARQGAA